MVKRGMGLIALLLCICLFLTPCSASAASTADAKEPISPNRDCTISLTYRYNEKIFIGASVRLYHIATVSADFQYTLTSLFANSHLVLNGIRTAGEWDIVRSTLESYILANGIVETITAVTDSDGQVTFDSLKTGLYFAAAVQATEDDTTCFFDSSLIAAPGLGADALWEYQVTAIPKPEVLPPIDPDEETQFKVLKLWKGDASSNRPDTIEIELFRNGESYQTVILSEATHWSFAWTAPADGADWVVVERNIPSGYAMTVDERGTSFVITNTLIPDSPETSPGDVGRTGDTSHTLLYTIMIYVSGMLLVLLGLLGKRKHI